MHYLERRLAENVEKAMLNGGKLTVYNDTACGRELLDAWNSGNFGKHDIALQLSINSAQLRPNQPQKHGFYLGRTQPPTRYALQESICRPCCHRPWTQEICSLSSQSEV